MRWKYLYVASYLFNIYNNTFDRTNLFVKQNYVNNNIVVKQLSLSLCLHPAMIKRFDRQYDEYWYILPIPVLIYKIIFSMILVRIKLIRWNKCKIHLLFLDLPKSHKTEEIYKSEGTKWKIAKDNFKLKNYLFFEKNKLYL